MAKGEREKMIVLDIETSGLDIGKNGIWQIAALNMETGEEFCEKCRIDGEDEIMEEALEICGKTEQELKDKSKQTQKQLIENFLNWISKFDERIIAGHNVGWDISFLQNKCLKYGLRKKFHEVIGHRTIDLATLAQLKFREENGKFKTENGKNKMDLKSVLEFCGMKDERKQSVNGKITEGKSHNALEDVKLEVECFKKLLGRENETNSY